MLCLDISTHAPLAGRDQQVLFARSIYELISTHAPLAGRDKQAKINERVAEISTHAPLAGRDPA